MSDQAHRLRKLAELASMTASMSRGTSPASSGGSQAQPATTSDLWDSFLSSSNQSRDSGNPLGLGPQFVREQADPGAEPTNVAGPTAPASAQPTADGLRMKNTRVVAVTSGKGGVGKTNFVTNFSIALATIGQRVMVLDADLGLANIDVLLGVYPRHNLGHVVNGSHRLDEVVIEGPNGVKIIPGASGLRDLVELPDDKRQALMVELSKLDGEADILIIDTGAGLSRNVMDFVLAAEEVIIVTTPEPTAIADAYAMIKALAQSHRDPNVRLVVNQARSEAEARQVADQISSVAARFLNAHIQSLGYVVADIVVQRSVRAQKPFILFYPYSQASSCVKAIAERYATGRSTIAVEAGGVSAFLKRMLTPFGRRE